MNLHDKVKDYIDNATEFDGELALSIVEFQMEHIPFYGDFVSRLTGKIHFNKIGDVPPLPVEFYKSKRLFAFKTHKGFFESSGTTGSRSRVYYNEQSLSLYDVSLLKSYPLHGMPLKTFIDIEKYNISSLAYMVNKIISVFGGRKINHIEEVGENEVLFLTAMQLKKHMNIINKSFNRNIVIIETGGYKKFSPEYQRHTLYKEAKKVFRKATFFTEYGMTELFSQFYANEEAPFKDRHFLKVFTKQKGYLKVFDFANLYHISYLVVPDIIQNTPYGFEYIKRDTNDERGCSYTFG